MELNQKQADLIKNNNIVVLATTNKTGQPRAIFVAEVEIDKTKKDQIVITDNLMNITKIISWKITR